MAVTINGSGQLAVQIQSAAKTDSFSTTSTSYADVTGLSVTITPTSSSNKILVFASVAYASSSDDMLLQLVRGSTAIANSTAGSVTNGFSMYSTSEGTNSIPVGSLVFLDSPATTSATTYKIQALVRSGTGYVNRRGSNASFGASSFITIMEISG